MQCSLREVRRARRLAEWGQQRSGCVVVVDSGAAAVSFAPACCEPLFFNCEELERRDHRGCAGVVVDVRAEEPPDSVQESFGWLHELNIAPAGTRRAWLHPWPGPWSATR